MKNMNNDVYIISLKITGEKKWQKVKMVKRRTIKK
jgi:hypothetical protein